MRVFRIGSTIVRLGIAALPLILGSGMGLAQSKISVVPGVAVAGGPGSLSVSLASISGTAPAALEWTLNYSTTVLGSLKLTAGAATTAAGKSLSCAITSGAVRCLAWGLNEKTISTGVLATLSFGVSPHAPTSTPIGLTGVVATSAAAAALSSTGTGATLTIGSPNQISALTCTPSPVVTPATATCTVKFSAAATSPALVALGLGASSAKVTIPSSVTVPTGATSVNFALQAAAVTVASKAIVVATIGASTASLSLTLNP